MPVKCLNIAKVVFEMSTSNLGLCTIHLYSTFPEMVIYYLQKTLATLRLHAVNNSYTFTMAANHKAEAV